MGATEGAGRENWTGHIGDPVLLNMHVLFDKIAYFGYKFKLPLPLFRENSPAPPFPIKCARHPFIEVFDFTVARIGARWSMR